MGEGQPGARPVNSFVGLEPALITVTYLHS